MDDLTKKLTQRDGEYVVLVTWQDDDGLTVYGPFDLDYAEGFLTVAEEHDLTSSARMLVLGSIEGFMQTHMAKSEEINE